MPQLKIEKSCLIEAIPEVVFRVLSNLGKWRDWNPWLVTEPEAEVEVSFDGKAYSWRGRRTGSGSVRVVSEQSPGRVDLELTFLTPFKSKSQVAFILRPEGSGTRVMWSMDGSLPFFVFFLKETMTNLIGMDYDRGLAMLKDYVELGTVPAQLELAGPGTFAGCTYVGITSECRIGELGSRMSDDFIKLNLWAKETSTQLADKALSVYRDWDLPRGKCKYTAAFPVDEVPTSLPADFESGTVPGLKIYQIKHTGAYRHLGNAWATGLQMARGKEFRASKAFPPFERYMTLPGEVSEEKQEVLVCFPVR